MDIQFHGANALVFTTKNARLVFDDNLVALGGKALTKPSDAALFTSIGQSSAGEVKLLINQPGEYETGDISIYGVQLRGHMDEAKQKTAVAYKIIFDDVRMLVTGHIYPELSDRQLEEIGAIDILFVPVGGNGYTVDPVGAAKLIKQIEPKIVIPVHYDQPGLNFEVPQQPLEQALSALGLEPKETVEKLRIKSTDLPETTELRILSPVK